MKVTSISMKPINGQKLKASGNIELDKEVSLSYLVVEGSKGPFVSWKGTEQYDKADGTKGYSSPIFIKNESLNKEIQSTILDKYKVEVSAKTSTGSTTHGGNGLTDAPPF